MKSRAMLTIAIVLMICTLNVATGYACDTCGCQATKTVSAAKEAIGCTCGYKSWYNPVSWFKKCPVCDLDH